MGNYFDTNWGISLILDNRATHECRILECNSHYVRMKDISNDRYVSEPLLNINLTYDERRYRLMLIVSSDA
ncbi:MAG: hypothetical protein AB1488_04510 [Nitrospirota bacterium]